MPTEIVFHIFFAGHKVTRNWRGEGGSRSILAQDSEQCERRPGVPEPKHEILLPRDSTVGV
jgi:hypothetical protein